MTPINLKDIKKDVAYAYYQNNDDSKIRYLSFIKLRDFIGDEVFLTDITPFYRSGRFQVDLLNPEFEFRISLDDDISGIEIFEITQDEFEKHVLMESL